MNRENSRDRVKRLWNRIASRFIDPVVQRYVDVRLRAFSRVRLHRAMQDLMFPPALMTAEKVMVILTIERNEMTGGVFSIFSIANQMRKLKRLHGYEVVLMTIPSWSGETYFRNTWFVNSENVYRFAQLPLCEKAKEIYLHVPEYGFEYFYGLLSDQEKAYLASRSEIHVNILNQNITMMPDPAVIESHRARFTTLTQSVAHHAYFTQEVADHYGLPTLLLPAYSDLSAYQGQTFADKEKLIIYSSDDASYKQQVLDALSQALPDFQLVEITNMPFETYMDLAARCLFSVSFGEGFDGYLSQPTEKGGIGFAVYRPEFFPSEKFLEFENIFSSPRDMLENMPARMIRLSKDEEAYTRLNQTVWNELQKLYPLEECMARISKLALREFELQPGME